MQQKKVHRFSGILLFIGWLIVIPSILGVLFSILVFFVTGDAGNEAMTQAASDAEKFGASAATAIGFGMSLFMAAVSLVGGLVGFLLLMKKKVWQCLSCDFILDRA